MLKVTVQSSLMDDDYEHPPSGEETMPYNPHLLGTVYVQGNIGPRSFLLSVRTANIPHALG